MSKQKTFENIYFFCFLNWNSEKALKSFGGFYFVDKHDFAPPKIKSQPGSGYFFWFFFCGIRWGPKGPAAFAGDQGARRHSPGTKGPGGIRRGPGGRASWAPGGYRRGPRGPAAIAGDLGAGPHGPLAAIAGDQGARRLSPGTWGPGPGAQDLGP